MKLLKKLVSLAIILYSQFFSLYAAEFYFEKPEVFSQSLHACFPQTANGQPEGQSNAIFFQEADTVKKEISLYVRTTDDGFTWNEKILLSEPVSYSLEVPCIFSCARLKNRYAVSFIKDDKTITVVTSTDGFKTIKQTDLKLKSSSVAPRIFPTDDGFILFVTQSKNDEFSISYSTSKNAQSWNDFLPLDTGISNEVTNPLSPAFIAQKNTYIVVFTAQYHRENRISIQLFSCTSGDRGKSWSKSEILTDEKTVAEGESFYGYSNQGANLFYDGSTFHIAWERSDINFNNPDIYHAELSSSAKIKTFPEKISVTGFASRPVLFTYKKALHASWFTNQAGNKKAYIASYSNGVWDDATEFSSSSVVYPCPILNGKNTQLSFVWQKEYGGSKTSSVEILLADHSTLAPQILPVDFTDKGRANAEQIKASIKPTEDSSGVKGFSWIFTSDPKKEPPKKINAAPSTEDIALNAKSDGVWYFKVRQCDFAENWSEAKTVTYERDTTAPLKVSLKPFDSDDGVLLNSNSFTLEWDANKNDDDIAGYSYTLKKVCDIPPLLKDNRYHPISVSEEEAKDILEDFLLQNDEALKDIPRPRDKINLTENKIDFTNIRNGLYIFSVVAVDSCFNVCREIESTYFVASRFIPSTYISDIQMQTDLFGETSINIFGTGFTYDGKITAIYLDDDGEAPYQKEYLLSNGDYKIHSNSSIGDFLVKDIPSGTYKIILNHSDRGLYVEKNLNITINEYGTVKQKVSTVMRPLWKFFFDSNIKNIPFATIILFVILFFALTGISLSVKSIASILKETRYVKIEVQALIEGGTMPEEKKSKALIYKNRGLSLKSKLILNTTLLIAIMDIAIFIAFGLYMIRSQERTLSSGLMERSNVMLSSLSRSAKLYLPAVNKDDALSILDLSDSVSQISALKESKGAIITGFTGDEKSDALNLVWTQTQKEDINLIDTPSFIPGESRISDTQINGVLESFIEINSEAVEKTRETDARLHVLTEELLKLSGKTDEASDFERQKIIFERTSLTSKLDAQLESIADSHVTSIPYFDSAKIDTKTSEYTFLRPVLYRQETGENFVHGAVIIKVSTEDLIRAQKTMRFLIFRTGIAIILIALIIGIITTYKIAGKIVKPISTLVEHLAMIRDTKDKSTLYGKTVDIKSGDEIEMLGDTVNQMTETLVQAALQSKELTFGKEVQAKFLPLAISEKGEVDATSSMEAEGAQFFSYYAGADDLSGDYFDYHKIDENHFAIIKCDVSGHGIPAALIMVEVATLFLSYFSKWDMASPSQGTNLAPVVSHINDLLESRGFKGRFAAFTLCILNTQSGECWFCNAGDNEVQLYDGSERRKKTITLQQTPAAGMFTSDLIDVKGGYNVSKITLKKDDMLFLYTDGIEEAKRNCFHFTSDALTEELSAQIVTDIIESVFDKKTFTLKRNCEGKEEELHFDFSTCNPSSEDAILALVSVEKAFRLYKKPDPKPTDRVKVDKKIDGFLHEHFKEYALYCADKALSDDEVTTVYYRGVLEDPQYDDLTLIAIKKL